MHLFFPLLVFFASLLCIKDALNIVYEYSARGREALVFLAIRLSAVLSLLLMGGILFIIIYKGIWIIDWEFLTTPHRKLGQAGGISTAIMGSLWMVLGAMIVSSPLGIGAAIYLHEYSKSQRLNRLITIAVSCLNGVPSVVFGLFGLAFLVTIFGVSLLSGSIILGLINIPTIILTCQEALKSVPNSLREGSMALGATKWQTIRKGSSAFGNAWHPHRSNYGSCQGLRRNGPDHVDRRDLHRYACPDDLWHYTRSVSAGKQFGLPSLELDLFLRCMGCRGQGLGNSTGADRSGAGNQYAGNSGEKLLSQEDFLVNKMYFSESANPATTLCTSCNKILEIERK